jgi:putative transposase
MCDFISVTLSCLYYPFATRGLGVVNLSKASPVWHTRGMNALASPNRYKNHRFPRKIISHTVWRYFRFCLSNHDVEELLFVRGISVTDEAIRQWCRTFGQQYANQWQHQQPRAGDTWHLDEVVLTMNGERHDLWRAVDQDGRVLDLLVQRRRDTRAAKQFCRTRLTRLAYVPRVMVTDTLGSYGAATRAVLSRVEHRQHRSLNSRAQNSHQPTR